MKQKSLSLKEQFAKENGYDNKYVALDRWGEYILWLERKIENKNEEKVMTDKIIRMNNEQQ